MKISKTKKGLLNSVLMLTALVAGSCSEPSEVTIENTIEDVVVSNLGEDTQDVPSNDQLMTKDFPVQKFNKVELAGNYNVTITKGETPKVVVRATETDLALMKVEVKNKALKVIYDKNPKQSYPIEVDIVTNDLRAYNLSGYSGESVLNDLSGDFLKMTLDGAGSVELANCTYTNFTAVVNGTGDVNALDSEIQYASVEINGAGNANINVSEELNAEINGVGSITYSGDADVNKEVNGFGSVTKR